MKRFSLAQFVLGIAVLAILVGGIVSAAPIRESGALDALPVIKCGFLKVTQLQTSANNTTIAINGTSTVYTKSFFLPSTGNYLTHGFKAASSGTVNLTITLEQGIAAPETEGAADATWALVSSVNATLSSTTQYRAAISTLGTPYGRYKIVGGGGNDASTTLTGDITVY